MLSDYASHAQQMAVEYCSARKDVQYESHTECNITFRWILEIRYQSLQYTRRRRQELVPTFAISISTKLVTN